MGHFSTVSTATPVNTLIVGASAAGLACAACLKKEQIDYLLLEQHTHVGHSWRNSYEALRLHTPKSTSHLPFLKFSSSASRYPSREEVVAYLEAYTAKLDLQPRFGQQVEHIERKERGWQVITSRQSYQAKNVIIATGYCNQPYRPTLQGMESFPGPILHSCEYKNGQAFSGLKVLVAGFGNSACDIALCLQAHGGRVSMSVRAPVNIIPRDVLGIPILKLAISQRFLPPKLLDTLNMPLLRRLIGNVEKLGLKQAPYGAAQQIALKGQIPVLDTGIVRSIKAGKITIYPAIDRIEGKKIIFENGESSEVDAVVLATGYRPAIEQVFKSDSSFVSKQTKPFTSGQEIEARSLYLCGFYVSPTGMLREIGIEAKRIAQAIKAKTALEN